MPPKDLAPFSYISPQKTLFSAIKYELTIEFLLANGQKVRKWKKGSTHKPRYCASAKISFTIAIQLFYRCRRNARKKYHCYCVG